MKAAILEDQQECERKLRVANHQSVCGCNLQLEIHRDKIDELTIVTERLNSENIKLLATLQSEQSKVARLTKCVCDVTDGSTQTDNVLLATSGTITDNISQVKIIVLKPHIWQLFWAPCHKVCVLRNARNKRQETKTFFSSFLTRTVPKSKI